MFLSVAILRAFVITAAISAEENPLDLSARTIGIVYAQALLRLLLPHQQLPIVPSCRQSWTMPS
jgi:hypothetical protein